MTGWIWLGLSVAGSVTSFFVGDPTAGVVLTTAALVMILLAVWQFYTDRKPVPVPALPRINPDAKTLSGEPVDQAWLAKHVAERPDCSLCKSWGWIS